MEDILQSSESEIKLETIKNHIAWWERKRIMYNIVLFICGIIPLVVYGTILALPSLIITSIIIHGVMANLCYCAGWGIGFILWHYTKRLEWLTKLNQVSFLFGLVISAMVTLLLSLSMSDITNYMLLD